MKKIKAILCAMLAVCLMAVPLSSAVVFDAGGVEDVQSLQDQIKALDEKSAEYQAILDATQTDINEKEQYGEALISKIQVLNDKVILTRQSIEEMNQGIKDKQAQIDQGNQDIEGQIDALCERLHIIYMAGSASNLEILLGAKDFDDFIDKMELVKSLSAYDKQMIDDINDKLKVIETQRSDLENDKLELEAQEVALQNDLEDLNSLLEENQAVLADLSQKSAAAQEALQNSSAQHRDLEAQIAAYFAEQDALAKAAAASRAQADQAKRAAADRQKQAAQQKQQQATQPTTHPEEITTENVDDNNDDNNNDNYDDNNNDDNSNDDNNNDNYDDNSYDTPSYSDTPIGDGYLWPCPGFYYLSSLWNEDRYTYNHGAIDIAGYGIQGAPVVAAASGYVYDTCTYCTHNWGKSGSCGCGGGFGNYVWLNHGNGKETIYGHLTSVVVSPGEYVEQGQVIGYVGSTGHSTGPHLHFECRYNGTKYNPMEELAAYWGMVSY